MRRREEGTCCGTGSCCREAFCILTPKKGEGIQDFTMYPDCLPPPATSLKGAVSSPTFEYYMKEGGIKEGEKEKMGKREKGETEEGEGG